MVNNKSLCSLVTMCVSYSGYMSLMLYCNSFDQRSESICLRYFIVLSQSSRSEAEDDYLNSQSSQTVIGRGYKQVPLEWNSDALPLR